MKKKVFSIITLTLIILTLTLGENLVGRTEIYESLKIFNEALVKLRTYYFDIEKIDTKELIYGAIEGMLRKLGDPHTRFMTPDVYKEMKVETKGKFGGLGIVITIREEQLVVISPIEGTPAHKAGVKAGDKIIKINGESTEGITLFEAVHKLRGPKGTKVTITIRRKEEGEEEQELEFTITRDIIEIESVKYSLIDEVKDCKIGYVKITNFNEKTVKELREALNKLKKEGMEELILDLRHNPGGLLDAAVDVADEFFDKELIVSTKGRKPNQCKEYKARAGGSYVEGPLIVLIDGASASASEIVAGAIKDNARGVVLGKKSFGKGSVQTVLELKDGSAVAITTAKYFTPNGVSIHKVGIEPDIVVERMKIGKEEVRLLRKLREENYIKEFIDKHSFPYEEDDFEKFVATLSEKGFKLRKCLIREEINKEWRKMNDIKEPIYHLLLDTQLQRAVDILIASKKLEKTTK